jgi:hypothetical protein
MTRVRDIIYELGLGSLGTTIGTLYEKWIGLGLGLWLELWLELRFWRG